MSTAEPLCARCARHKQTCCQGTEIYVTPGDAARISQYVGRADFLEFRVPADHGYLDQDDDPPWREHALRPDNTRRVLKWQENRDCIFLGRQGCALPLEVRPLVCRLHPFDYTSLGLRAELAGGCPLELLEPGQTVTQSLAISDADAIRWHRQLYDEINLEARD